MTVTITECDSPPLQYGCQNPTNFGGSDQAFFERENDSTRKPNDRRSRQRCDRQGQEQSCRVSRLATGYSHLPKIAHKAGIVVTSPTRARVAPTAFRCSEASRSAKSNAIPAPIIVRVAIMNANSGRVSWISFIIVKIRFSGGSSSGGMPPGRFRSSRRLDKSKHQ